MEAGKDMAGGQPDAAHRTPDLDAVLADLSFEPNDAASVEAAVRAMDAAIDAKVAPYALNPDVQEMADAKKAVYRRAIRERAPTG